MRKRWIPLLLALLLAALTPGWALAGFDDGPRMEVRRALPMAGSSAPRVAAVPASATRAIAPATVVKSAPSGVAAPRVAQAGSAQPLADWTLFLPPDAANRQPLRVLVALHGMGGNGPDFARPLLPLAEQQGWAVLAPTLPYRDYRDPELVRRDGELLPRLKALLETLPAETSLTFRPRVLFYGFSRGSQEAHRFSFMYPEATLAVAGLSAGSYTLPFKTLRPSTPDQVLNYPFGISDVDKICGRAFNPEAARQVKYWIAVGASDTRSEDVPRQWDGFLGKNRVERAQRFVGSLQQFGAQVDLTVFPNVGHEVTDAMREAALRFLAAADVPAAAVGRPSSAF